MKSSITVAGVIKERVQIIAKQNKMEQSVRIYVCVHEQTSKQNKNNGGGLNDDKYFEI